jgi:hypothetical protein
MNPITGLMRNRANAGMTMPAAPRMTNASLKPLLRRGAAMGMI